MGCVSSLRNEYAFCTAAFQVFFAAAQQKPFNILLFISFFQDITAWSLTKRWM
ncbi:hypothetical protein SAMN06265373_104220 [Shimia sagamensis]|uniref:Uncharacterized protein n=1 Tax=Shimia sagamensis TaxID=1566352 RepID=A0ABY1P1K1_9RHOB|nr:hypothetical protein SAMN06265373_104220 [Shimia sagamensis]